MRLIAALCLIFLFSCGQGETIVNNFEAVDSSLNKTSQAMESSAKTDLSSLPEEKRIEITELKKGVAFIDDLRSTLSGLDVAGESFTVADSLIKNHDNGKTLFRLMKRVNALGQCYTLNNERLERYKQDIMLQEERKWLNAYFNSVPTVAATTMLLKFKVDVQLVINDIIDNQKRIECAGG
jgi:hypothetical protein